MKRIVFVLTFLIFSCNFGFAGVGGVLFSKIKGVELSKFKTLNRKIIEKIDSGEFDAVFDMSSSDIKAAGRDEFRKNLENIKNKFEFNGIENSYNYRLMYRGLGSSYYDFRLSEYDNLIFKVHFSGPGSKAFSINKFRSGFSEYFVTIRFIEEEGAFRVERLDVFPVRALGKTSVSWERSAREALLNKGCLSPLLKMKIGLGLLRPGGVSKFDSEDEFLAFFDMIEKRTRSFLGDVEPLIESYMVTVDPYVIGKDVVPLFVYKTKGDIGNKSFVEREIRSALTKIDSVFNLRAEFKGVLFRFYSMSPDGKVEGGRYYQRAIDFKNLDQ